MKASELRIGNYVYRQSSKLIIDKSSVYQIENVNLQSALKYEPILLTEEWLIKFGWGRDEEYKNEFIDNVSRENEVLVYDLINEILNIETSKDQIEIRNVKYVHQLQNIYFALTGEELTVNN